MSLVLFTCMVGLLIAPYSVDLKTSLISLLAVAIGSGAAGALNMWYESDVDALMSRTCLRPIPTGKVKEIRLYILELFYQLFLLLCFTIRQILFQQYY